MLHNGSLNSLMSCQCASFHTRQREDGDFSAGPGSSKPGFASSSSASPLIKNTPLASSWIKPRLQVPSICPCPAPPSLTLTCDWSPGATPHLPDPCLGQVVPISSSTYTHTLEQSKTHCPSRPTVYIQKAFPKHNSPYSSSLLWLEFAVRGWATPSGLGTQGRSFPHRSESWLPFGFPRFLKSWDRDLFLGSWQFRNMSTTVADNSSVTEAPGSPADGRVSEQFPKHFKGH